MVRGSRQHIVAGVWAAGIFLAAAAHGDDGLRLDVAPPGARSLGLGGAFLALADDATAAYANPAGLTRLSQRELSLGSSFGSFVYPRPKWAVAVYGHRLAEVSETTSTDGPVGLRPVSTTLDILSWGVAAGFELTDDLSLGLGWAQHQLDLSSRTDGFGSLDRKDESGGLSAGLAWRPGGGWSIGGVYRQGPTFALDASIPELKIPDVYGLGVALQPTELWTISLDLVQIEHEDLLAALPPNQQALTTGADATEIHLGAERSFPLHRGLLVARLGLWHEPEPLRYTGGDPVLRSLFPGGEDETHVTAGVGRSLPNLQVDAAVDHSPRETKWSISAGVRF